MPVNLRCYDHTDFTEYPLFEPRSTGRLVKLGGKKPVSKPNPYPVLQSNQCPDDHGTFQLYSRHKNPIPDLDKS